MAFFDIVHSGAVMDLDRSDVGSFIDIVSEKSEMHFPLITGGGGGAGGEHAYVF